MCTGYVAFVQKREIKPSEEHREENVHQPLGFCCVFVLFFIPSDKHPQRQHILILY